MLGIVPGSPGNIATKTVLYALIWILKKVLSN